MPRGRSSSVQTEGKKPGILDLDAVVEDREADRHALQGIVGVHHSIDDRAQTATGGTLQCSSRRRRRMSAPRKAWFLHECNGLVDGGDEVCTDLQLRFRAIDRALTDRQMREIPAVSTRTAISRRSFSNYYAFGNLKADPSDLLVKYFDASLYFANWLFLEVAFRYPEGVVDVKTLRL
jgi:hypothetical protein